MQRVELLVLSHLNNARIETQTDPELARTRIGFAHWLVFEFSDDMSQRVDADAEFAKYLEHESKKVGA